MSTSLAEPINNNLAFQRTVNSKDLNIHDIFAALNTSYRGKYRHFLAFRLTAIFQFQYNIPVPLFIWRSLTID